MGGEREGRVEGVRGMEEKGGRGKKELGEGRRRAGEEENK